MQTLQNLLDETREQNDRLSEQVKEMRKEVQSYREAAAGSSEQSDQALLDEIAHLQLAAGMTDVVGARHRGGARGQHSRQHQRR